LASISEGCVWKYAKKATVFLDVGMPKRRDFPPFENVGDFKAVGNLFGMAGEIV